MGFPERRIGLDGFCGWLAGLVWLRTWSEIGSTFVGQIYRDRLHRARQSSFVMLDAGFSQDSHKIAQLCSLR